MTVTTVKIEGEDVRSVKITGPVLPLVAAFADAVAQKLAIRLRRVDEYV